MSGVRCILGQNALRPSVNLSRDYKIVFNDSQESYLKSVVGLGMEMPEAQLKRAPLMTSSYSANRDNHFRFA